MSSEHNTPWQDEQDAPGISLTDSGAMRVALLFGSAAVAFALLLTPLIDRGAESVIATRGMAVELDNFATGSVSRAGDYTIRRSVLQSSPGAVCVIRKNGDQSGEC